MEKRRNQISHLWVKKDTKAFSLPLLARSNIMVEKGPNDVLASFFPLLVFSLPLFARSNIMVEKGPNDVLACFLLC